MTRLYHDGEPIPAGTISEKLSPDLQARMDTLAADLRAAGFSVAIITARPGENSPSLVSGDARALLTTLNRVQTTIGQMVCTCPECAARREKDQVRA
ncbi:hypothetical protein GCM10008959_25950 [Deinococcus seoulensis]|uniref:Uncharacterized protein n=1 Tax=Deinococcus seoulensis TaxID=1837379 RepID=A0ABQ2RUG8_9DEIO|nr:hypothetical protein [Deinococcus seoulensis]GGR62720.1 hypothetical protein GCM10008959_25950 [Deinococcus seoulensis]